jgi:hypothetical protein
MNVHKFQVRDSTCVSSRTFVFSSDLNDCYPDFVPSYKFLLYVFTYGGECEREIVFCTLPCSSLYVLMYKICVFR